MGSSRSSSSNKFSRTGTETFDKSYSVPEYISNLVKDNLGLVATNPTLAKKQSTLFSNVMEKGDTSIPGYGTLSSIASQSPTGYTGRDTLSTIAARNPYGGTYENETQSAYERRARDAMAQVATGPEAVRGGDSRTAILQSLLADRLAQGRGQEVRAAQAQETGHVLDAAKSAGAIETNRTGQSVAAAGTLGGLVSQKDQRALDAARALDANKMYNLSALQLGASLAGTTRGQKTYDLSGEGSGTASDAHIDFGCCFIFLQALNGVLPWYIDRARWDYLTPNRYRGYKWMSSWLVPAMKRHAWVQWLVNAVIVKPFLKYGAWLYHASERGRAWTLYCKFWLGVWSTLGSIVDKKYGN